MVLVVVSRVRRFQKISEPKTRHEKNDITDLPLRATFTCDTLMTYTALFKYGVRKQKQRENIAQNKTNFGMLPWFDPTSERSDGALLVLNREFKGVRTYLFWPVAREFDIITKLVDLYKFYLYTRYLVRGIYRQSSFILWHHQDIEKSYNLRQFYSYTNIKSFICTKAAMCKTLCMRLIEQILKILWPF